MKIHIDFETRSEVNIWEVGAWAYSCHHSTHILCLRYCIDDGPIFLLKASDITSEFKWQLQSRLLCSVATFCAFNAFFEQCIWKNILVKRYGWPEIPIKQWRCVMAKSLARALPRSLEDVAQALGLEEQKDKRGYQTMLKLCKPNKDGTWNEDPKDLEILYDYCGQDVATERAVDHALPDLTPAEQQIWFLDQTINQRGIYVDIPAIERCLYLIDLYAQNLKTLVESVSNGKLDGVSKRTKVLEWCRNQGVDLPGYNKAQVKTALDQEIPDEVRTVLETRQQLGKSSTKKYQAMWKSVGEDHRIRDTLIYHGASTGRWAGKIFQVHNLPRGNVKDSELAIKDLQRYDLETLTSFYPDVMGTLSSCLRGMILAGPGNELLVGDYNAIETRVLFWLANEELGLNQFKNGEDLYVHMAKAIYSSDNIGKGSVERQLGKAAVLGCGYGLGALKFYSTCISQGVQIEQEVADKAVSTYRQTYRAVPRFWYDTERSALNTVRTGQPTRCGRVTWKMDGNALLCQLPSGRSLVYNEAEIQPVTTSWKEVKDAVTFMGLKKVDGQATTQWSRQSTYGGKLVENITQAVARDLLAFALSRSESNGYPIAFHVHDEAVAEVAKGDGRTTEAFVKILEAVPSWAHGCPIKVEAFSCERYKK